MAERRRSIAAASPVVQRPHPPYLVRSPLGLGPESAGRTTAAPLVRPPTARHATTGGDEGAMATSERADKANIPHSGRLPAPAPCI